MEKNLEKILKNIGFPEKEAKVYLGILEEGKATAQKIAQITGIKRATVYTAIEALKDKGFVFQTKDQKKTYFIAAKPGDILQKVKEKSEEFEKNLDSFMALGHTGIRKPKITLFKGTEGFKVIWKIIFDSNIGEYLIITDAKEMLGFVRKGYITGKIIKKKVEKKIKSRQIIASSEYAKEIIAKDKKENRTSKILPHIYKIPYTILIFGNKVALISPSTDNILAIIEGESFTQTHKSLFEFMWRSLPE